MSKSAKTVSHPNLKGSEQHHDLKGNPGEKGDPDHQGSDGALPDDVAEDVSSSKANTQIADELRKLVDDT